MLSSKIPVVRLISKEGSRFDYSLLGHLQIDEEGVISGKITDEAVLAVLAERGLLAFSEFRTEIYPLPAVRKSKEE